MGGGEQKGLKVSPCAGKIKAYLPYDASPSTPHPEDYRCDFVKVYYGSSSISIDILGPDVPVVVLAGSTMLSTEAPPLPLGPVSLTFSPDAKNKNLKSVIEWKVLQKNQLPGVITMAGMTFTSVTDFSPLSHFQITYTFNNICSKLLLILFLYTSHSAIFHVIAFCYNLESHTHTESLSICNFCGREKIEN